MNVICSFLTYIPSNRQVSNAFVLQRVPFASRMRMLNRILSIMKNLKTDNGQWKISLAFIFILLFILGWDFLELFWDLITSFLQELWTFFFRFYAMDQYSSPYRDLQKESWSKGRRCRYWAVSDVSLSKPVPKVQRWLIVENSFVFFSSGEFFQLVSSALK